MPKFNVTRSVSISSPVDAIYDKVREFKTWPIWSPWLLSEPDCPVSYSDDGKSYSWNGKIVGSGEMLVTNEEKNRSIEYQLTFFTPWKSVSKVSFSFSEAGGETEVTWTMDGSLPFFMFWMKPMMSAWIGMDYERGLNMLKDLMESGSVPSKLTFEGERTFPGCKYIGVRTQCSLKEIGPRMEKDFGDLFAWVGEHDQQPSGACFSIYHRFDMVKGITEYTAGIPLENIPQNLPSNFVSGELEGCKTYVVSHTGSYRHLGNAWSAGMMRARAKVFKQSKAMPPFETYENDPSETPEGELLTNVCFPMK